MTNRNRKIFRARARPFGPLTDGPALAWLWLVRQWQAILRANQDRLILALPALFGCGIAIWFGVPVPVSPDPLLIALIASAGGALWWGRISVARHAGTGFAVSLAIMALASGVLATGLRSALVHAPMINEETVTMSIEGRVRDFSRKADGSSRVVLDRLVLPQGGYRGLPEQGSPERVRVSLRGNQPAFQVGDTIALRAQLRPPSGPVAPRAHDFARDAYFDRIGGTGFAYGAARLVQPWDGAAGFFVRLDVGLQRLRHVAADRIYAAFDNKLAGGVAVALLTGERGLIPADTTEDLRGAGLAHLLAISGLHMGLAAGILFFTLRYGLLLVPRLRELYPIKKIAAAGALIGAFGYLLLSGASVSAERAFIMVACGFAAVMIDRVALSMRLVGFAAMAILIWRPENLLNAGFQMSFAAVAALIAVYEEARDRPDSVLNRAGQHRFTAYAVGLIATSLIAGLATAPYAAWHFGRVADYGLLANLLAMPVMVFWVMPLGALSLVLLPFGLADGTLQAMGWGISWIAAVADRVTGLAGAEMGIEAAPVAVLALISGGLVWLCLWRGSLRAAGIAPIVVAISLWAGPGNVQPDILVSHDASLIGVLDGEGNRHYSTLRKGRYAREQWQRRDGDLTGGLAVRARCDQHGCIYPLTAHGMQVVSVADWQGLAEECAQLQAARSPRALIIAQFKTGTGRDLCPGIVVLDQYRLEKEGPVAITTNAVTTGPSGISMETASTLRGNKPWNYSTQ